MSRSDVKSPSRAGRKRSPLTNDADVPTSPYSQWSSPGGKMAVSGGPQFERIQKIAADLFATKGYRAVGVAEIGDAVGLGRGALYYHISSKEDLLFSIVVRHIEDLVAAGRDALESELDPRKRIYLLSRKLMATIFANLPEMTVCFREADCLTGQRHRMVSNLHQAYQDIWTSTFQEGEKKGLFRPLPTIAIKGILGMYFYSFLWLKPTGRSSSREIADVFADMALSIAEAPNRKAP